MHVADKTKNTLVCARYGQMNRRRKARRIKKTNLGVSRKNMERHPEGRVGVGRGGEEDGSFIERDA